MCLCVFAAGLALHCTRGRLRRKSGSTSILCPQIQLPLRSCVPAPLSTVALSSLAAGLIHSWEPANRLGNRLSNQSASCNLPSSHCHRLPLEQEEEEALSHGRVLLAAVICAKIDPSRAACARLAALSFSLAGEREREGEKERASMQDDALCTSDSA